jgi:hypothetical protein
LGEEIGEEFGRRKALTAKEFKERKKFGRNENQIFIFMSRKYCGQRNNDWAEMHFYPS